MGDPLSPLLFVLVMEILTRELRLATQKPDFQFHPMCKDLKLTNLSFADDLILFCKGNVQSVKVMIEAFNSFSASSGLYASSAKSNIFLAGVNEQSMQQIQAITDFNLGPFP
ncbi:hypothetical protein L6164_015548 [Bauhinia variegata]|uniref:Uncharacterized protein n=1 Tax=Bauhinia variegata TaxID=167791 RepID=A0ACB9NKY1_BAUVA|nr:hypothetical protein L6164_015548 [Bauhinia variegata]